MVIPVLSAKITLPPRNPAMVRRERLSARLNRAEGRRLILVNAPAGYGKTSLASEWAHQTKGNSAWFSIDQHDNNVSRFITYLVCAVQTLYSSFCQPLLNALTQPEPINLERGLTGLLNELAQLPAATRIILDDYHQIEDEAVHAAVIFLIEHLPENVQLVITSRIEPPFPLHRWRARGQLIEIRAAELGFTLAESQQFLNQGMGLALTAEEIRTVDARVAGWVTALQMVALAMQTLPTQGNRHTDFFHAFAGSQRYLLDYLREEIVLQQPARIRQFLLHTAFLERLSAPLCDAVLQIKDSQEILAYLESHNLLIAPLDEPHRWYRYHPLFTEFLQASLAEEDPDCLPELHRRAGQWYAQNGAHPQAITHALACEDVDALIALAEDILLDLYASHKAELSRHWLPQLPVEVIRRRPLLCLAQAIASSYTHPFDYERIQAWAEQATKATPALLDQPLRHPAIPYSSVGALVAIQVACLKTTLLRLRGSPPDEIIQAAKQALALTAEDDFSTTAWLWMAIGRAELNRGDAGAAERATQEALALSEMSGDPAALVSALWTQAYIAYWQGRLRKALRIYQRAEAEWIAPAAQNGQYLPSTSVIYTFWASVLREMNQLDAAEDLFLKSQRLAQFRNLADTALDNEIGLAWLSVYRGKKDGIQELEERLPHLPDKKAEMLQTHIANMKLFSGDRQSDLIDAVFHWADRQRAHWQPMQQLENTYLIWVRALLWRKRQGKPVPDVRETLPHLKEQQRLAERAHFLRSQVQIRILQALVHQELGETENALQALEDALTLAQPEGYVRSFIDAGRPIAPLLRAALARGITPQYTRQLLAALEAARAKPPGTTAFQPVEPLTRRELEVLALVAVGLPNQQIAEQLVLARGTVKKYLSSVFQKLNVNRRTQAVARAKELGIL